MTQLIKDLITGTTVIVDVDEYLFDDKYPFKVAVTKCCGIGPITDEAYCSKCGKRIKR